MEHIPNALTILRFFGAACLLLCNPADATKCDHDYLKSLIISNLLGGHCVIYMNLLKGYEPYC